MKFQLLKKAASTLRACVFLCLAGLGVEDALALDPGAAPKLTGLRISTPAGDSVELSSGNEALRGIAIEADIEADLQGVDYFELHFTAPDGRTLTYLGSQDSLSKRNYLVEQDKKKQTYLLNEREIRGWYGSNSAALEQEGTWSLTSVFLVGVNGNQTESNAQSLTQSLHDAVATSFRVTRWFSQQPTHTSVSTGATLSLSPAVDATKLITPTYQWYKNGAAISGAKASSYTKAKAASADSGLYHLQVTSDGSTVRSDPVVVSVRSTDVVAARTAMNDQNGALAKTKSGNALKAASTGGEELFVSALAELVGVLSDTRTKAAMTALGVSGTLNFPAPGLAWSGTFAANTSSSSVNAWLSEALLPALDKAEEAFAKITDTKFVTTIGSTDFGAWGQAGGLLDTLAVDYGDVQMLRALSNGLSSILRLWGSLDTTARLDWLQTMRSQGKLTVQSILTQYPTLLAAAAKGADSQTKAVTSLGKAALAYSNYSNFVFSSDGISGTRRYIDSDQNLFPGRRQFSQESLVDPAVDAFFKDYAANITASIASGKRDFIAEITEEAGVTSRYTVDLKALSARPAGLRSTTAAQNLIPAFTKNLATGAIGASALSGVFPSFSTASAARLKAQMVAAEPKIIKALGSREDQSAPVLTLTDESIKLGKASKVRLLPDGGPVRLSGTVQDESEIEGVTLVRTFGSVKETFFAELEPQAVSAGQKRTWTWSVELPFEDSGLCSYEIYATDKYSQKSLPATGSFTVAKAVRVLVNQADVQQGTLTVSPTIPEDGLVDMGAKLRVTAVAKAGYLFRLLEIVVNGLPEDDISRSMVDVVIGGETVITPQFIVNPFPALAGRWNAAMQMGYSSGMVNLSVTKTGTYSIKVTSGRNSFSYNGVLDASGLAKIPIPANFKPYGLTPSSSASSNGTSQYAYLSINSGIQFSWSEIGVGDVSSSFSLSKAGEASLVSRLPSRRYTTSLQGTSNGYSAVDLSPSGTVLYSGVVNVDYNNVPRAVRFCAASFVMNRSMFDVENQWVTKVGFDFYAVGSPSDTSVYGSVTLDSSATGNLATMPILTGPLDPKNQYGGYSQAQNSYQVAGYPYVAPKAGQIPLPFVAASKLSFKVTAGETSIGLLSLTNLKLAFDDSSRDTSVVQKATMSVLSTTGAFSGSLKGQVGGVPKSATFSGVLLQGGNIPAIGIATEGTVISFE